MHGWLLSKGAKPVLGPIERPAMPAGEVHVRVQYSSLNYKDGLALTGAPGIVRSFPMVPGIDLAGVVQGSGSSDFKPGDEVIAIGCGLGEKYWGGYATDAWLKPEWLVPLPSGMTLETAMAMGTAGFTAMQCVDALEQHHVKGDIVVTGASGGVGSIAIALLAASGQRVFASTGRLEEAAFLKSLGATELIDRSELSAPATRPMESERWDGAVDTVGGDTLAGVIRTLRHGGAVAACGLAGGNHLNTTVFPFILRGVSLLGINSVDVANIERRRIWTLLAQRFPQSLLPAMTETIRLEELPEKATEILAGKVRGRTIVTVT